MRGYKKGLVGSPPLAPRMVPAGVGARDKAACVVFTAQPVHHPIFTTFLREVLPRFPFKPYPVRLDLLTLFGANRGTQTHNPSRKTKKAPIHYW